MIINKLVSQLVDSELQQKATLSALLHQIGKLILLQAFPKLRAVYLKALKEENCLDLKPIERELFDTDHAQVGAYLLFLWGFPNSIVTSISRYNDKEALLKEKFTLATAIHFSHMLLSNDIDDDFVEAFELKDHVIELKELTEKLLQSSKNN
jgi:HD-like signal output (HDOD) protein